MIKIFLVEDNPDALYFLTETLANIKTFELLGFAENAHQAIETIERYKPDVVLMDIILPDMNGIDCVRHLKRSCPLTQFVMCTVVDTDEKVFESIMAGASSYIVKNTDEQALIETIEGVYAGQSPINGDIARKIINIIQKKSVRNHNLNITRKESEILEYLAKGYTYKEISSYGNITIKTLKGHIYRLYEKLQVDNRTEAVNKYFGN